MTRNTLLLLFCSLFLFTTCSDTSTTAEKATPDTLVTQPPLTDSSARNKASQSSSTDISQYIRNNMPGWSLPDKGEWEKYWYDRFYKNRNTVYRVQSDFDGNAQRDYAFILKDSTGKYAVWAFMGSEESFAPYRVYDITRLKNQKLHVGLDVLKAGTYNDLNTTDAVPAKVQTDHPAIHVIFFETAAKAYYWKDSAFHLIQTGD